MQNNNNNKKLSWLQILGYICLGIILVPLSLILIITALALIICVCIPMAIITAAITGIGYLCKIGFDKARSWIRNHHFFRTESDDLSTETLSQNYTPSCSPSPSITLSSPQTPSISPANLSSSTLSSSDENPSPITRDGISIIHRTPLPLQSQT